MSQMEPVPLMADSETTFQCARFNSSIFLPPTRDSPLTLSHPSRAQSISRKRPRLDHAPTPSRSWSSGRDGLSPPPLVNVNYRIAGGLDTPTAVRQREEDVQEHDFEVDCRPNRYRTQSQHPQADSYFPRTPASDEHEGNKRRLSRSPQGWGQTVWAMTGGVAGRIYNFCFASAFRGFHAGGGDGYKFDIGTPDVASSAWTEVPAKEDVFHDEYARNRRDQTPVPGAFPEGPNYMDRKGGSTPTKTSDPGFSSASRSGWVVVEEPDIHSRDTSPVRKRSRPSTASHHARPPARNTNSIPRPRPASRSSSNKSSASYASPRALSNAHASQPRQPALTPNSNFRPLDAASAHQNSGRPSSRASLASPRRQSSQVNGMQASPQVRKFEQKLRRKEAKQDETMDRFNLHLQAMIREGQQALGAKIEVVDGTNVDDEGYEEGSVD